MGRNYDLGMLTGILFVVKFSGAKEGADDFWCGCLETGVGGRLT